MAFDYLDLILGEYLPVLLSMKSMRHYKNRKLKIVAVTVVNGLNGCLDRARFESHVKSVLQHAEGLVFAGDRNGNICKEIISPFFGRHGKK